MTVGSEGGSTPATEKAEPGAVMQTPGAMLEHERTRRGLSIQQAAEGLHLDAWIIEAIETNRFLALGAPVYAKGYLRKYAMLLGLAPEVVVARYDALTDTLPEPTPVPVITTTPPPRPKWPKYVAWTLLAALLIAIGVVAFEFLWPLAEPAVSSMRSTVAAPTPEPPDRDIARSTTIAPSNEPELAAAASEPAVAPAAATPVATNEPTAAASPSSTASTGESVRLTLAFSDASWAEVYDATGQRLLYDIGQAGRAYTVAGTAPLNVVIGIAAAVQVQVNDREIVVPRRANRDSARFVVNADGSVR